MHEYGQWTEKERRGRKGIKWEKEEEEERWKIVSGSPKGEGKKAGIIETESHEPAPP